MKGSRGIRTSSLLNDNRIDDDDDDEDATDVGTSEDERGAVHTRIGTGVGIKSTSGILRPTEFWLKKGRCAETVR